MIFSGSLSKNIALVFVLTFGLVFCSLVTGATTVNAQTNALRISVTPQHPGPFVTVTISVEDFSRDLNKVPISWTINGKAEQNGIGLKRLKFTSGALGSVSTVSINMGGDVHQVVIKPTVTDLLWQTDTYTPPFYMGKALHSNQDPTLIVAEPFFIASNGTRLDPTKLIYKWEKNGKVDDAASGYGKKTYKIIPSILLKPVEMSVTVSSTDNSFRSNSTILIPDSQTEVLLYENHPLYGINFSKALNEKELPLTDSEVRILGIPFYFSNIQKNLDELTYNWRLNSNSIEQQGNEVIFRKPEGNVSGRSSVYLGIKNTERYAQTSNADFFVTYSGEAETGDDEPIF